MNGIQGKPKSESVQSANLHGGTKKKSRNWYWKNRDYWREYHHDRYLKNKERLLELNRKWVLKNKEAVKAIKKRYLEKNKWRRKISVLISDIKYRCDNKKSPKYKFYGGRGIKNFLKANDLITLWNRDKADKLEKPSIDRIDCNGHYTLDNCRFIEHFENAMEGLRKTRTHLIHARNLKYKM